MGQKGSLSYVWAPVGSRPAMVRDNRHGNAYIFGAICPARGVGAALILPTVNAECMSLHLAEISAQVAPGSIAVVICDGAGWHQTGGALELPDNVVLLPLPPYSPELNPMENVCGSFCEPTNSRPRSGTATTKSSTHASKPGTGSFTTKTGSNPSEPEIGPQSMSRADGIISALRSRERRGPCANAAAQARVRWRYAVMIGVRDPPPSTGSPYPRRCSSTRRDRRPAFSRPRHSIALRASR